MKMYEKKLVFYEYDELVIGVLLDDDENVLEKDIYNNPMYSIQQIIEYIFRDNEELAQELISKLDDNDIESFTSILEQNDIDFEEREIDELIFKALQKYLDL